MREFITWMLVVVAAIAGALLVGVLVVSALIHGLWWVSIPLLAGVGLWLGYRSPVEKSEFGDWGEF